MTAVTPPRPRTRHAYSLAAELGLPTGALSDVGSAGRRPEHRDARVPHGPPRGPGVLDAGALGALPLRLAEAPARSRERGNAREVGTVRSSRLAVRPW